MERVKEFLNSPKNTAILGLLGAIGLTFISWEIGLIVYFIFVLLRMKHKKANIKISQVILIINYVLFAINYIVSFFYLVNDLKVTVQYSKITFLYYHLPSLIVALYYIINTLYFVRIFFLKNTRVNNKMFVVISVLFVICGIIQIIAGGFSIELVIQLISRIMIIPYFYSYYNLLKGENKNAK